ncbi:MAG: hypothetical protein ACI4IK_00780 [Eubacterium sp.]
MSNYINRLISRIIDKKAKAVVKNELDDHYLELVDYYMDIGYNQEAAEAMADERLGEAPEQVGEQLSSINNSKPKRIMLIISAIISAMLVLWGFVSLIAESINILTVSTSVVLTLVFFSNILLSLKFKSVSFSVFGLLQLFLLYLHTLNHCQLTLMIIEAFTGRLDKLIQSCSIFEAYAVGEAPKYFSRALLALLFLLDIVSVIIVIKFNKLSFGKKAMKCSVALKHFISCLFVILLVFSVILFAKFNSISAERSFDQVEAVESNVPLGEDELKEYCKYNEYLDNVDNYLYIHFDIFSTVPDTHCDGNFYNDDVKTLEHKFDSLVSFMTYECTASYSTNSKYIYFIPKYYDTETDASKVICVQSGIGEECVISYREGYYVFKIKVR